MFKLRLTTSLGALLLVSIVFYLTNGKLTVNIWTVKMTLATVVLLSNKQGSSTSLPKASDETVSLANIPEKMMSMGKFLHSLQDRLNESTKASPKMGMIIRKKLLSEIAEKKAEIDIIDKFIRNLFESGSITQEDVKVDLELTLYNCDTFRALTDDVVLQIQEIVNNKKA